MAAKLTKAVTRNTCVAICVKVGGMLRPSKAGKRCPMYPPPTACIVDKQYTCTNVRLHYSSGGMSVQSLCHITAIA